MKHNLIKGSQKTLLIFSPEENRIGGVKTHVDNLRGSIITQSYTIIPFYVGSTNNKSSIMQIVFRLITSYTKLIKTIITNKPSVCHINSSFNFKAFVRDIGYLFFMRIFGMKVVFQIHGGLPDSIVANQFVNNSLLRSLSISNKVIVINDIQKNQLERILAPRKIVKINNMISIDNYPESSERDIRNRVLFLGRVEFEKGILDFLKLAQDVNQFDRDVEFIVVGDGSYLQEAVAFKTANNLNNIVFTGKIDHNCVSNYFAMSSIYIFPSYLKEGIPYSILEAMASSLPIIAYETGAIPELIENYENGFIIPCGDQNQLLMKTLELLSNPVERKIIGNRNREKVTTFYNKRFQTEKFLSVYNSLVC